ncbi:hypothetical protein ACGE0T_16395 [Parabacteroides sp. APC149_11_2_Y6]
MELLTELYRIISPSQFEMPMKKHITNNVLVNINQITWIEDSYGNMHITKGVSDKYICIAAHLDEKGTKDNINKRTVITSKQLETNNTILYSVGEDNLQCGLGADDKNGIYIALRLLQSLPILKVSFFVEEEIGCMGSQNSDLQFYDNCALLIECDKKGSSEIVTEVSGTELCPIFIANKLQDIGKKYGYSLSKGGKTDVVALKRRELKTPCVNISCGYYNPHSNKEFSVFEDIINCINFCNNIIKNSYGL